MGNFSEQVWGYSPKRRHTRPLGDGPDRAFVVQRREEHQQAATPEHMHADLSWLLDATPIPEELDRSLAPSRRWPASLRIEYMIAVYVAAGWQVILATVIQQPGSQTLPASDSTSPPRAPYAMGLAWLKGPADADPGSMAG